MRFWKKSIEGRVVELHERGGFFEARWSGKSESVFGATVGDALHALRVHTNSAKKKRAIYGNETSNRGKGPGGARIERPGDSRALQGVGGDRKKVA